MAFIDHIRRMFGPPEVVQRVEPPHGFPPRNEILVGAVVVGNLIFDGEDTSLVDRAAYSAMPFWVRSAARRGSETE